MIYQERGGDPWREGNVVFRRHSEMNAFLTNPLQSDPYVRVQLNNVTQGRTEVVNNSELPCLPCLDRLQI
jgi:hypothetical protein